MGGLGITWGKVGEGGCEKFFGNSGINWRGIWEEVDFLLNNWTGTW